MTRLRLVLALALITAAPLAGTPAGAQQFADTLCPRATPRVDAFTETAKTNDPAKIAAAAKSVADAYLACWNDAKVRAAIEPIANYDETRMAQFLVVTGRASAAAGKTAEAVQAFKDARTYANDVAEWIPSAQSVHSSSGLGGNSSARNTDRQPSRYREAAVAVRSDAIAELAKLTGGTPSPGPGASPAAGASPAPVASPKP